MMTRASLALMIALLSSLLPTPALAAVQVGLAGLDVDTAVVGIERERDIPPP
jgi:hypothetical protein